MRTQPLIYRGVTVSAITLLLALAFAPSIHANIQKETLDSELAEFTTEVYGLPGMKTQSIQLTKDELEEVDSLFENIKEQLEDVETKEEAVWILNKAVVELDKYGLVGGLGVKQAQRLITKVYQIPRFITWSEKLSNRMQNVFEDNENVLCLLAGKTEYTSIENLRFRFWLFLSDLIEDPSIFQKYFYPLAIIHILFTQVCPITIGGIIGFGLHRHIPYNVYYHVPAQGWIYSIGLNGIKKWNGSFWGSLPTTSFFDHPTQQWHPGVLQFHGINIIRPNGSTHYFLGSALWTKIEYDS